MTENMFGVLETISDQASQLTAFVDKLRGDFETETSRTDEAKNIGLSYLDVKNLLLLNYNCDIAHVILSKCKGRSLVDNPAVDRLTETRTVMEKTRGVDLKLKYQIEKLVRAATVETQGAGNDPLSFRPNLTGFDEDDDVDGDDDDKTKSKKDGVYRPPKLAAVRYDGDDTEAVKREKRAKIRSRAVANAALLKDLDLDREEPEEIFENNVHRFKEDRRLAERTKYEEDNFTRLVLTKKDKARMKRLSTASALGDAMTNFSGLPALWRDDEDGGGGAGGKKPKKVSGTKRKLSKATAKKMKAKKRKRFA